MQRNVNKLEESKGKGNAAEGLSLGEVLRCGRNRGILCGSHWFKLSDIARNLALADAALDGYLPTAQEPALKERFDINRLDSEDTAAVGQALDAELSCVLEGRLSGSYTAMMLGSVTLDVRATGGYKSLDVSLALGLTLHSPRVELLDVQVGSLPEEAHCLSVLAQLQPRGVDRVRHVVGCDTLPLWAAVKELFPEATAQYSVDFCLSEIGSFSPMNEDEERTARCERELELVFRQWDLEAASEAYNHWEQRWAEHYDEYGEMIEASWHSVPRTLTLYELPSHLRQSVGFNLPVLRLQKSIERVARRVGVFSNEASLLRVAKSVAVEAHGR